MDASNSSWGGDIRLDNVTLASPQTSVCGRARVGSRARPPHFAAVSS